MKTIRIGCGAGYSGDRIEPAVELVEKGDIDYLIFECLAERTIAIAQQAKCANPENGYDPLLVERMRAVLEPCVRKGVKIITNMGAANPLAGMGKIRGIARDLGLPHLKIAAVTGDDVMATISGGEYSLVESGQLLSELNGRLISANAYLGAQPIVDALAAGADVVITGRAADPSLTVAALVHEFGWRMDDWDRLGQATLVGHLLECAGQVTGGYFADPGYKDVANLARLGFPIAEVSEDGSTTITKVAGTGGKVTEATCKEQILYEIHDPAAYITPDVVADFSKITVKEAGPDLVMVAGARGKARPDTLKVSVGYKDGFIGEGQISFAGRGAVARGQLALEIVKERLAIGAATFSEIRYDLIGVNAVSGIAPREEGCAPAEVRVRVAARTSTLADADRIGNEVETLYTCGPAGGGGATKVSREVIAIQALLLPRQMVKPLLDFSEISS